MDNPPNQFDPYAAPTVDDFSTQSSSAELNPQLRKVLKDFHSQSLALGVLWCIFAAVLFAGAIAFVFSPRKDGAGPVIAVFMALVAIVYAAAAVGALTKQPWGFYVGLSMAYITFALSAIGLNICVLGFSIAILIQGHRILTFIKTLKSAGIPLTTKL